MQTIYQQNQDNDNFYQIQDQTTNDSSKSRVNQNQIIYKQILEFRKKQDSLQTNYSSQNTEATNIEQDPQIQRQYYLKLQQMLLKEKNTEQKRKLIYNQLIQKLKNNLNSKIQPIFFQRNQKIQKLKIKCQRYQKSSMLNFRKGLFLGVYKECNKSNNFSTKKIEALLSHKKTKQFLYKFLKSSQSLKYFKKMNVSKFQKTQKTFYTLLKKIGLEKLLKSIDNNPEKFSKVPWSLQNFELARKEFLVDFFQHSKNDLNRI